MLGVVIPATDAPRTLPAAIAAIRRAKAPPEELIVRQYPAGASPASARNAGAREAAADVVVFVDADVEVALDAFERIRHAFASDPELTAIFGSYDDSPSDRSLISTFRNLLHHHVHQQSPGRATTFWTGLGAIRRDAFLAEGGFDELRFPSASVEDVELGMRLTARGAKIELDPEILGKHLKRWTLREMIRTDLSRRGVPWVQLLLANRSQSKSLNLAWRHRVSAAASVGIAAALALGRPRLVAPPLVLLLVLNRSFYRLILRKRGGTAAAAAVPLHVIHHLTSAVALPLGIAYYVFDRKGERSAPRRSSSAPGSNRGL